MRRRAWTVAEPESQIVTDLSESAVLQVPFVVALTDLGDVTDARFCNKFFLYNLYHLT